MEKMKCPVEARPVEGDVFVCESCQHTVLVVRNCACDDHECVSMACCGEPMTKVNGIGS
jgi:hypothetical protein